MNIIIIVLCFIDENIFVGETILFLNNHLYKAITIQFILNTIYHNNSVLFVNLLLKGFSGV